MRIRGKALVAAPAALTLVLGAPLPASAVDEARCSYRYNSDDTEAYRVCTYETPTHQFYGDFRYSNGTEWSQGVSGTIIVQRCQAGGVNCVTITAHHYDRWVYAMTTDDPFVTDSKAGSYGYTYRTCVSGESTSGWTWVFSCSLTNPYSP